MKKLVAKEEMVKDSNQPHNQKPFDVLLNEEFGKYQKNGFNRNWFVPVVKNQTEMDKLIEIRDYTYPRNEMDRTFPNILLVVNKDDEGNLISIYVLYQKGGKLFKVISQKDYGVIKSRMELKNGKYIPYEKCDLVPFDGIIKEYDNHRLVKSISYKNGLKDGESITYYVDGRRLLNHETNKWVTEYYYEKTTFKNGKKNGDYENTKYNTKGNFINNNKNGVWKDSFKNIYNSVSTSYQSKFDISDWELDELIKRNFGIIQEYEKDSINKVGVVFYVNDVLNGDFRVDFWEGKFELGLPNGLVTRIGENNWKDIIYSKLFENGLMLSSVKYDGGDREEGEEMTYCVNNYEDGFKTNSMLISSNIFEKTPSQLTSQTKQFLTEDVFYTIVKNGLENCSLESFLEDFVVLNNTNWNTDVYGKSNVDDSVSIKTQTLVYGLGSYDNLTNKYLIEECSYPHFEVDELEGWNGNIIKNYNLLTSSEYRYYSDYCPYVHSLVKMGETTKLLINDELIEETIDGETNPIVLEFQKVELQNLSDKMKSSYDLELKRMKIEKQREEERKEQERVEKGLSINSFPMD
jgi:antitoxin component YwqK of YwqJK toxin-antitoxin module